MYVFAIFRLAGSVQLRAGLNGGQFKTRPDYTGSRAFHNVSWTSVVRVTL